MKRPRPAPFAALAGDSSGRTGFGSRRSLARCIALIYSAANPFGSEVRFRHRTDRPPAYCVDGILARLFRVSTSLYRLGSISISDHIKDEAAGRPNYEAAEESKSIVLEEGNKPSKR
jgi:hypothetical protein